MSDKPVRLPRKAGKPVPIEEHKKQAALTPFEEATLSKLDLDAQQLPAGANLESLLAAVLEEDRRQLAIESPVPPDTPPIAFDEDAVTPVEKLSARQRAKLLEKIGELREIDRQIPRQPSSIVGMDAAIAAAEAPTLVRPGQGQGDDAPEDAGPDASPTGADGRPTHCPKCGHDQSKADPLVVERQDRLAWIASLYGARFKKAYSLFDGQITLVFQSLTVSETQLAYVQTQLDVQRREFTLDDYLTRLKQYRLAMMLESVSQRGGKVLVVPKDLILKGKARDLRPEEQTNLPQLREYLFEHVIPSESLARIVHAKHAEFQRLLEWMEANADNPDFMKEISGL